MELHEEDKLKELLKRFKDVEPNETVLLPAEPPEDWLDKDKVHYANFVPVKLMDILQFIADMR